MLLACEIQQAIAEGLSVSVLTDKEWREKGNYVKFLAYRKRPLRSKQQTEIGKSVLARLNKEKRISSLRLWLLGY